MFVPRRRLIAVAALCLTAAMASTAVSAADVPPADVPAADVSVEHESVDAQADPLAGSDLEVLQGDAAVDQLVSTGSLDDVAADAGVEPDELITELVEDPSLFLTADGSLGYAEAVPLAGDVMSSPLVAVPPGTNVSALSSKPTSPRVIYLDFDGHVSTDDVWASLGAPASIASAPFDNDGAAGFSAAEQALIFEIWQRVTEDYLPFDVNVTTLDPGVEALRRRGLTDASYGQRMVISPTNWVGANTLGVALVDSFDEPEDRPAYVFTPNPGAASTKTIAEAVSHEAGHTFGLLHDGEPGSPYYDGHGIWAPIMGRGIAASTTVSQWSRGEYAGADNQQDDLAVIADYTGVRPDDHGASSCTGTVVGGSSATAGIIGTSGDRDVFVVEAGAGSLAVTLSPPPGAAAWSNLFARVIVRNSTGAVVASGAAASPTSWSSATSAVVPAGRYTIEVEPIGWLDASSGFTAYGSLGAYELTVAAAAGGAAQQPVDCRSTFTAITPERLVDTRNDLGGSRVGAGRQVVVQATDGVTVPFGATAAVFSIIATSPAASGYLTAYPCSSRRPDTSTVNYAADQTVANNTIATLSSAGQLCVWTFADTDIIVDVTGWLGPSGKSRFTPIGPDRVVDTRSGIGGGRLGAGATLAVDLGGVVPAGTTAVGLNATAVGADAPGFLSVFPCGPRPPTSTVNYAAGEARPNNTIVGLSAGRVCVYSSTAADVLLDLTGSFGSTGLSYKPTLPARVLDTRQTRPLIPAGGVVGYSITASALGADRPAAAFVNVTAVDHTAPGYVTTYDCGVRRETSTVNQEVGEVGANGANVPLDGVRSCAWLSSAGHLIVDINGWWVR